MTQATRKYTVWNIPRSSWTERAELEKLVITERTIEQFKKDLPESRVDPREAPFDTPVTPETLSQSAG